MFEVNLMELFYPARPFEIFIRGTITYLALVVILRLLPRRGMGSLSIADLLVIVVIADAAQNALSGGYKSITEGIILVVTIIGWDYTLDLMSYRFPAVRRLLHSRPLLLVRDGKAINRNLKLEALTTDELLSHLRQQGVENLGEVKRAYLEDDGQISIIKRHIQDNSRRSQKRKTEPRK
ncbi:MAG TPA: YetF domain-containing protein [Aestuariivirgaceae bacterium]|jgi:uncharacterized membrane protein YcaP (DUF421 family)